MTTTTHPAVTITAPTFRRMIGDMVAAFDRATIANRADNGGLWADRHAAARTFVDAATIALDMVDPEAVFEASAGGDMLPGEVAEILGNLATVGAAHPIRHRSTVVAVDMIRQAVTRGTADDLADDRCATHGAGPIDGGSHPGFAGPIYVTRYACGCTDVDASADTIDAAR